jgi:hypothetical protein
VDILDLPTPSLLVERGAFERNVATMAARWPGTQLRDRFPRLPPPLACMPRHEPTTRRTRRRLRASDESSLHRTSHLSRSHRGGSEGGSSDLRPNHTDTTMPELLIDYITSLDGYGTAEGWPGWWGLEGPQYLGWVEDSPEADYTVLMGDRCAAGSA